MFSNGSITINYGSFKKTPQQREIIDFIKEELAINVGFSAPDDYERRYPSYKIDVWSVKVNGLLAVLESLNAKYPVPEIV